MAKFVKLGEIVLDIDQVAGFEQQGDSLSVYLKGRESAIKFHKPQAAPIYEKLIGLLKPEDWHIPAQDKPDMTPDASGCVAALAR
jgi:hypothetical protein